VVGGQGQPAGMSGGSTTGSTGVAWLAANRAGTMIASIRAYPGYLTPDPRRGAAVSAMMSLSSVTGAVWHHTRHTAFIAMEDS
jgi:hypothetical protein